MQGLALSNRQTLANANNPFRRYAREPVHEVRQPDVTGQSFAERVAKARQMLRSMDPEKVKQVIEFRRDLNFLQALALAKQEGSIIVPNDVHDRILTETTDEQYLRQNYPVWTGTLVIYEAPDKKFGEQVVSSWKKHNVDYSISFEVPEQFRGKTNCALVVEHPDFELIDFGNNKYELRAADSNIHLVQDFAKKSGLYSTDHGIPVGLDVGFSKDASYLGRTADSYIGLIRRGVYVDLYGMGVYVLLNDDPSDRFRVALISPVATSKEG